MPRSLPLPSPSSLRAFARRNRWWLVWFSAVFLIRSMVVDWYYVPSGSMYPSIQQGHYIFINRLAYSWHLPFTSVQLVRWGRPRRGDPVVLFDPRDGTRLVKRVIGIGGDTILVQDGHLVRNGEAARYEPGNLDWPGQPGLTQSPWVERWSDGTWEPILRTESPVAWDMHRDAGPFTVPAGMVMVMGDNRDNSEDSRVIGMVPVDSIAGRVLARPLPLR